MTHIPILSQGVTWSDLPFSKSVKDERVKDELQVVEIKDKEIHKEAI